MQVSAVELTEINSGFSTGPHCYNIKYMIRPWLAMAVLFGGTASGAGPSYVLAGVVNAANYAAGPFAPNSVLSVFGSGLSVDGTMLKA